MIAALLFDMDGVLVDSEPAHEDAARVVLRAHDLPEPDGLFDQFRGRPDRDLFGGVLREAGRDASDVASLVRAKETAYASMTDRIVALDGVFDVLTTLERIGVPRACVTSATRADQQVVFDAVGLAPYFAAVVTADDVTHGKPNPEPYCTGANRLGVDPSDAVVVEDSPHGVEAARAAGCIAVGLPTSFDADVLVDAGAGFVAASHADLLAWLAERL